MKTDRKTEQIVIHTILQSRWIQKETYAKWRVELALKNHPKRVCWLSHAQYGFLVTAFEHTKNGYSDTQTTVIGHFDCEKGYYLRCEAHRHPPKRQHHTPLLDHSKTAVIPAELTDEN